MAEGAERPLLQPAAPGSPSAREHVSAGFRVSVPEHVAIIMDGNRRWAAARGLPAVAGHSRGEQALRRTVAAATEAGVSRLTVFAFSTENWARGEEEVAALLAAMETGLAGALPELHSAAVRLTFFGDLHRLSPSFQALIRRCGSFLW